MKAPRHVAGPPFLLPPPALRSFVLLAAFSAFFFSRFFSESSDTLRMLPYDCMKRRCSFAVIMHEILQLAPVARTRQPTFASASGVAVAAEAVTEIWSDGVGVGVGVGA